jgi:hypothetical protein
MARLIHHQRHTFPTVRVARPADPSRLLLRALQIAVLGGIAAFVILAVVNTVLGTPDAVPVYTPYE